MIARLFAIGIGINIGLQSLFAWGQGFVPPPPPPPVYAPVYPSYPFYPYRGGPNAVVVGRPYYYSPYYRGNYSPYYPPGYYDRVPYPYYPGANAAAYAHPYSGYIP